jgi:nicotinate-nucleotide adenylyltransferase
MLGGPIETADDQTAERTSEDASTPRLGVFGGTFDPTHQGHLIIAEELRYRLGLDQVLFLLAKSPPHKTSVTVSPEADRLAMLELAIAHNDGFIISRIDLDRVGPSYTADSLALIRREHPEHGLYFLMGEDSLRDLPTWHDPNRIARQAMLVVARRPGIDVDLPRVLDAVPDARGRVVMVDIPLIEISSSDIRRRVRAGEPIRYQVPDAVERYIRESGIYRS